MTSANYSCKAVERRVEWATIRNIVVVSARVLERRRTGLIRSPVELAFPLPPVRLPRMGSVQQINDLMIAKGSTARSWPAATY
jgi:hypothetical protein